MYRVIKTVIKIASLFGGICLVAVTALLPEAVNLPFSRITGLTEVYNKAEEAALSIIPDEIEMFVSRLYKAINRS